MGVLAVASVLIPAAVASQASFTVLPAPGVTLVDMNAEGSAVLYLDWYYNMDRVLVFVNSVLTRSGQVTQLYGNGGLNALEGTGVAAWGGLGGSVVRVTGPLAADSVSFPGGVAEDVSADGQCVVGTAGTGASPQRAFAWARSAGSTPTMLEPLAGHVWSEGSAVSSGGVFVAGISAPSAGAVVPVRWSAGGGGATVLATPTGISGVSGGFPRAIADSGLAVGETGDGTAHSPRPLVWDIAGVGRLMPGVFAGAALAVSADGAVAGGYSLSGNSPRAVVWAHGRSYVLRDLLATYGVSTTGYTLGIVRGVSADGSVVAGEAVGSNGHGYAFFATLPGPGCFADVGSQGGQAGRDGVLDNNDLIEFVGLFFAQAATADIGRAGGVSGPDSAWDNNDFAVFIERFFAGCS